jgi:drug/metabolite transporter (DMT)-like permease
MAETLRGNARLVKILNERLTLKATALALLTSTLWGGNSVAIKIALAGIPPLALAGARFLLGGLVVTGWSLALGIPLRLSGPERRWLLLLVLLFLVQIYLLNTGTHYTSAGRSTVFISTYPFFTSLFAHLSIPGDRLSRLKIVGMVVSFTGVVLIFAETLALGDLQYLAGDLMVLASALLLGARQVYAKWLTQGIHPAKLLLYQASLSLPVFFVLSALLEHQAVYSFTPQITAAVLYQGLVIAGFCFIVATSLLRRYRASRLGVFGFITPVFGVLLSNLLLGEGVSAGLLVSVVLVGAGIAIVNSEA